MADNQWVDVTDQYVQPAAAAPTVAAPDSQWEDVTHHYANAVSPAGQADVPSGTEAALRGAAQGATLGFSDRLEGGGAALFDKLTGNDGGKSLGDLYAQKQAEAQAANSAAQAAHPYIYGGANLSGGLASGLATGGLGAETALGRMAVATGMGAAGGVGYGHPQDVSSGASDALKGALVGGATGAVGEGIGSVLGGDAATAAKNTAEDLAENATGGTGAQAARFQNRVVDPTTGQVIQKSAGRELLDRNLVGGLDSQADIAKKVAAAAQESGEGIEDSLAALDSKAGAPKIARDDILTYLQNKAAALSNNPAEADSVRQINSVAQDVVNGPAEYTLGDAEAVKRGFDGRINYKNPDAINEAKKAAADAYRENVESKATQIDPTLADQFTQNKKDWGLLKPILEAAQRRAEVTKQSPPGGLLDMTTMAASLASGHPAAAIAAPIARRAIASRVASTAAVGADKLGDILQTAPDLLGPWASQLAAAAARGGTSLASTNYILSQTNSDYRQHMAKLFNGQQQ